VSRVFKERKPALMTIQDRIWMYLFKDVDETPHFFSCSFMAAAVKMAQQGL
jgi:hypothetical protein